MPNAVERACLGGKRTSCDVHWQLHKALNERCVQALSFEADVQVWKGLSVLLQTITGDMNM